jgi:hypothetical protein
VPYRTFPLISPYKSIEYRKSKGSKNNKIAISNIKDSLSLFIGSLLLTIQVIVVDVFTLYIYVTAIFYLTYL